MTTQGLASERFASFAEQIKLQYALAVVAMLLKIFVTAGTVPWILSVWIPGAIAVSCLLRGLSWARLPNKRLPEEEARIAMQRASKMVLGATVVLVVFDIALFAACGPAERLFMIVIMLMSCVSHMFYFVYMPRVSALTASWFAAACLVLAFLSGDTIMIATTLCILSVVTYMSHVVYRHNSEFISLVAAHAQLKKLGAENERLASTDTLTGLPNRREFFKTVAATHEAALANSTEFAVGIADLDGFKAANDTYGHSVGDEVLAIVATRMQSVAGERAAVYRIGGDEFAFIVSDHVHPDLLTLLAEAIIASISQPLQCKGATVLVGCSIGIAMFPRSTRDVGKLYEAADEALYASKRRGRGCVTLFSAPRMDSATAPAIAS